MLAITTIDVICQDGDIGAKFKNSNFQIYNRNDLKNENVLNMVQIHVAFDLKNKFHYN